MSLLSRFWTNYVLPYAKAHVAGFGAGVSVLAAETNGNLNALGSLSLNDWVAAVAATGIFGVWTGFVKNRPAPGAVAPAAPAPVVSVSVSSTPALTQVIADSVGGTAAQAAQVLSQDSGV